MRSDTVMGASGCILKKKEDINIDQLIDDIRIAADRAGSPIIANKKVFAKDDGRFRYMAFNIFDKEKQTMFYYICLIFPDLIQMKSLIISFPEGN